MPSLTFERALKLIDYDPNTGIMKSKINRATLNVGNIVGSMNKRGYLRVAIDGKEYYQHRIAFLLMTGKWPTKEIDHIDENKANNCWTNLREATRSQNESNKKKSIVNASPYKGVFFRRRNKYNPWESFIKSNNRQIYLGSFPTAEEANKVYIEASIRIFGEFAQGGK